jgi:hypothetical protein
MLLLAGFLISLFLVYHIAVKSTVDLRSVCKEMELKIDSVRQAPVEIKMIENRLSELNKVISNRGNDETDFHEALLVDISNYCDVNGLVIKNYPESHLVHSEKYIVETDAITIEGNFTKLLKLIYMLETENKNGHLASIKFESIPDHRNNIYKLNLTIYEQNIFDKKTVTNAD